MAKASIPFKWNYIDPACEGKLPVDDSDGGCDDEPQCKNYRAWTGEHPAVRIMPGDAISDQGQEIYNLFEQRGIKNILYLGVHANMCVLGRSFGIREMSRLGKNVCAGPRPDRHDVQPAHGPVRPARPGDRPGDRARRNLLVPDGPQQRRARRRQAPARGDRRGRAGVRREAHAAGIREGTGGKAGI